MLDYLEKAQWIGGGLLTLLILGMFVYPGIPPAAPDIKSPVQTIKSAKDFTGGMSNAQRKEYRQAQRKADSRAKRGRSSTPLRRDMKLVGRDIHEVLSDKREVVTELRKVGARFDRKNKRVVITKIKPSSLLNELGFRPGDTIEAVNGEQIPLDNRDKQWELYERELERVEAGGAIVVTVKRGNSYIQKAFRMRDLNMK